MRASGIIAVLTVVLVAHSSYAQVAPAWVRPTVPVTRPTKRFANAMWTIPNGTLSDDVFIYGGYINPGVVSAEVWHYSVSSNVWTQMATTNATTVRAFHRTQWTPVGLVIEGGVLNSGPNILSNQIDVIMWDPANFEFTRNGSNWPANIPPTRLVGHTMSYAARRLYIFGGYPCVSGGCNTEDPTLPVSDYEGTAPELIATSDISFNRTTGFSFDESFSAPTNAPSPNNFKLGYAYHTATVVGNDIWILGGKTIDSLGSPEIAGSSIGGEQAYSVLRYDTQNDTWAFYLPTLSFARWGHTAELFGNNIFIFGGRDGSDAYVNELRSLDVLTAQFTIYNAGNAPPARGFHSMALVQRPLGCQQLLVFGGTNSAAFSYNTPGPLVPANFDAAASSLTTIFVDVSTITVSLPTVVYFAGCVAAFPNVTLCIPTGNVPLTLNGTNLGTPGLAITIGGVACNITAQADTQITCLLPPSSIEYPQVLIMACGYSVDYTGRVGYAAACDSSIRPNPRMGALMWTAPNTSVTTPSVFVYGGLTPSGPRTISQEVWNYNLLTSCWTQDRSDYVTVSGGGFPARVFAQGAHTPDGFVIFGGATADTNHVITNEVDVVTWMPLEFELTRPNVPLLVNPPNALFGHSLTYFNGSLFIIGGWSCAAGYYTNCPDVNNFADSNINAASNFTTFDFGATPFSALPAGVATSGFHTATLIHETIYIYGGVSAVSSNQVSGQLVAFTPATASAVVIAVSSVTRWGHTAQAFLDDLYIYGGRSRGGSETYVNTLYRVDVGRTNTFTLVSSSGSPRAFHSMVLSKSQSACHALFIYGGTDDTAHFHSSQQNIGQLLSSMVLETVTPFADVEFIYINSPIVVYFAGCVAAFPNVTLCIPTGNVPLTLNGTNLGTPGLAITIGGVACNITAQADTQITCLLPPSSIEYPQVLITACGYSVDYTGRVGYAAACDPSIHPDPRMGALMWTAPNTSFATPSLFVYGGVGPAGPQQPAQDVWIYNLLTGCWTEERSNYVTVPGGGHTGRAFASGAHTPTGFVMLGGATNDPSNVVTDQVDAVTWMPLQFDMNRANVPLLVNPPLALFGHTLTYFNGALYIIGGWPCAVAYNCNGVQEYPQSGIYEATNFTDFDFGTAHVAALNTGSQTVGFHTATVIDDAIYIYGGISANPFNQVFGAFTIFYPANGTVSALQQKPVHLWGHTAAAFNGDLYIFGGRSNAAGEPYQNSLYVVDAGQTNTFTLLSNPLTPRGLHSMALVQFESCFALAVYGGTNDPSAFNSGKEHQELLLSSMLTETVFPFADVEFIYIGDSPNVTSFAGCTTVNGTATECPQVGNDTLSLLGTNLGSPTLVVLVDGLPCKLLFQNHTFVECALPAFNGTLQPTVIVNSCGTSTSFNGALSYTGIAIPGGSSSSISSSTGGGSSSSSSSGSSATNASSSSTRASSGTGSSSSKSSSSSSSTGSSTGVSGTSSSTAVSGNSSSSSSGVLSNSSSTATSDSTSSTAGNDTTSSTAVVAEPATSTGLTAAQFYGAVIGGTVGGVVLIGGVLLILAWQFGWWPFNAAVTAMPAYIEAANVVGGRARMREEERFPLMSVRRL